MPNVTIFSLLACAIGAALCGLFVATGAGRYITARAMGWLFAIAPAIAFVAVASQVPAISGGEVLYWQIPWMPALGVSFSFTLDGLSALFALLITGIGAFILIYSGYYFSGDTEHECDLTHAPSDDRAIPKKNTDAHFFFYILLFMTAMLGLVLAGDVITLFLFWEGTSITSYLLIGYKTKDEAARRGAFKAMFMTGGGGIALLAGLLFTASIAGSTDFTKILSSGDALRASAWYPVMLALIAFGAFTKSAQVPMHFWLPSAMTAPTPASAYLHSATMVKAGVYLLARMNPALGDTELWFWLLTGTGVLTFISGAYMGLRQFDLKAVLAYSTISILGSLVMLIGLGVPEAYKALVIGVLAHALYKGALFLVAGIVDHETGTRDLRILGNIWRAMPLTFIAGGIAAMSMGAVPPLLGFLQKETLLAAALEAHLPSFAAADMIRVALPALAVASGALLLAQAGILALDTFVTRSGAGFPVSPLPDREGQGVGSDIAAAHGHEPPIGMLAGPGVLALLSLLIPLTLTPLITSLLAEAAKDAYGGEVEISLALFTGVNAPLLLSAAAIALGVIIFAWRSRARALADILNEGGRFTINRIYDTTMSGADRTADLVTRLQNGRIRRYLTVMLIGVAVLLILFGNLQSATSQTIDVWLASEAALLQTVLQDPLQLLRAFSVVLSVAAASVTIVLRRDLLAIIALGASGLSVAVLIALQPSPDVALVQVIVDILSTTVLVLALSRLPQAQRARAEAFTYAQSKGSLARDAILAIGAGVVVTTLSLYAFASRPRESIVTPYYEENSEPRTGSEDVVGAIVVDFRGFDTMIEITVFGAAGLGVYSLLRYAMKRHSVRHETETVRGTVEERPAPRQIHVMPDSIYGIGGLRTSPFVHALAYAALPISIVLGIVQMIYGHDQPGDGFTAGVTISLGIAFWYIVFGYENTLRRLFFLRPTTLIGCGILVVTAGSIAPVFLGGTFFSPFDFGQALGLPLPKGFTLSTSFLFEIAICLAVLGSALFIIDTLGHPEIDIEREFEMGHAAGDIGQLPQSTKSIVASDRSQPAQGVRSIPEHAQDADDLAQERTRLKPRRP
jgi:NADH:ubiquinone oxidoreductase subunit 5 (subunit L)/multisubunit Na+/H+ antiporter MnhA subunit